jgi:hypothetical protein
MFHSHGQAMAFVTRSASILTVDYRGWLNTENLLALNRKLHCRKVHEASTLNRMNRAMIYLDANQEAQELLPVWTPPAALIVHPESFEMAVAYCASLAKYGVLRTAWLPEHEAHALNWCAAIKKKSLQS